MKLTEAEVYKLENKHKVKAIPSNAKELYYFFDDEKLGLCIRTSYGQVILTKKQAKALSEELKDIYEMVFN